jgi:glycosyltransferase involved in cell wall biosynthesis
MRILHVSTWNRPCGIASYCGNLVASLEKLGVTSDVYRLQPHLWRSYTPTDAARLRDEIARHARGYDLVHIQHEHGFFGCANGFKAATRNYGTTLHRIRLANTPVVTTFHTEPIAAPKTRDRRLSLKAALGHLNQFRRRAAWRRHVSSQFGAKATQAKAIVHTTTTRRAMIRHGMPADAVHLIEHGCLPLRDLSLEQRQAKQCLGMSPSVTLLTMFGFVSRYKGHHVAIQALARMPARFHLAICGGVHPESDERYLDSLLRLIEKLRLQDRVTITGWLDEAAAELYYAATDICLAPYTDASLSASGAITWALASGKPTIGSRVPAFRNICREHECMLLTTPHSARELVWAVEKLRSDPSYARSLVRAAAMYVESYSWDETARSTADLYNDMLSGQDVHAPGIDAGSLVALSDGAARGPFAIVSDHSDEGDPHPGQDVTHGGLGHEAARRYLASVGHEQPILKVRRAA